MGCGCGGGSGAAGTGSRRTSLIKKPGYTWNGPEPEAEDTPEAEDDDSDDEG